LTFRRIAELINTTWKAHRMTPMHNFKYTQGHLKSYAQALTAALHAEARRGEGVAVSLPESEAGLGSDLQATMTVLKVRLWIWMMSRECGERQRHAQQAFCPHHIPRVCPPELECRREHARSRGRAHNCGEAKLPWRPDCRSQTGAVLRRGARAYVLFHRLRPVPNEMGP